MITTANDKTRVEYLFEGWGQTIPQSCLNDIMGTVYAPNDEKPTAAAALLGDFCFLAGTPDRELLIYLRRQRPGCYMIMIPRTEDWKPLIGSLWPSRMKAITRHSMKKEPQVFSRPLLEAFARNLPENCSLHLINQELYSLCQSSDWSRDLVSQYKNYRMYNRLGLGVAAVKNGAVIAGASSYSSFPGGIEVEIDTHPAHRRQGLAAACGARLILKCLDRGLYPSWDAHTEISAHLAQKLGYHYDQAYTAYEIWGL